ncbi:MAG TPA: hypothetical protein VII45_13660 [Solirubrobacterales bacterium]
MLAVVSVCLAIGPTLTREEYVSRLEAVCRPRVESTERVMKGVRDDVRAERDATAAKKFGRGAAIFKGTIGGIVGVPRPTADAARLAKWFVYLNRQEEYLRQITLQLRAQQMIKAQRSTARFIHNGNLANNVVLAFGFNYCSFRFSRFG